MGKRNPQGLGFIVDKLTNSIEETESGESSATRLIRRHPKDASLLSHLDWKFDWRVELRNPNHEVYALTTLRNPEVLHGLISIEDNRDHVFVPLIESAPFNIGQSKQYEGVPGNLVAFACHRSLRLGYDGVVAFVAKSRLVEHYEKTLFAKRFAGNRMFIDEQAADRLIQKYFKNYDADRLEEIG